MLLFHTFSLSSLIQLLSIIVSICIIVSYPFTIVAASAASSESSTTVDTTPTTGTTNNNDNYIPGIVATKVFMLRRDNFKVAIEDPANPVWLLKFYAPWCGHCKKMAPILDTAATKVIGKLAIGKIDCTTDQNFCQQFAIKGYPTIKFSLDGEIYDYPNGRTENDILSFANKINRPDVHVVSTIQDIFHSNNSNKLDDDSDKFDVSFVAYHPQLSDSEQLDTKLASTVPTQVYAQVARHLKASGHFLLLDSQHDDDDDNDDDNEFQSLLGQDRTKPFICRIEQHVPVRCIDSIFLETNAINKAILLDYIVTENVPTVIKFGPSNFHKIGRQGKLLVIGIISNSAATNDINTIKSTFSNYAINGPANIKSKYYYGYIDGKMYYKFLEQFDITKQSISISTGNPQIFVLDFPKKKYWYSITNKYKIENINELLNDIENNTIQYNVAGKKGFDGFIERSLDQFMDYMPYSLMFVAFVFAIVIISIFTCISPGDDLRPPYNNYKINNNTYGRTTIDPTSSVSSAAAGIENTASPSAEATTTVEPETKKEQ